MILTRKNEKRKREKAIATAAYRYSQCSMQPLTLPSQWNSVNELRSQQKKTFIRFWRRNRTLTNIKIFGVTNKPIVIRFTELASDICIDTHFK